MRNEEWNHFFQFTRRETTGIMALLFLILGVFCLPVLVEYFWPPVPKLVSLESERLVRSLEEQPLDEKEYDKGKSNDHASANAGNINPKVIGNLFSFDPNTLDDEGWRSLGVAERTVKTIRNYLLKGGKFRKVDDIKRIYGLSPALAERLLPYVQIASKEHFPKSNIDSATESIGAFARNEKKPKSFIPASIDINKADSLEWLALEGIGPALTHRILSFREKLGGFYSTSQIGEVYGLPDSTFQQLLPKLRCSPGAIKRIPLNSAAIASLESHPYIRKKLARLLVAYRDQHGPYQSVADLRKIQLIDTALLTKLVPYINVEGEEN